MTQFWELFQKIANVGSVLAIAGAIYLYFEARKFKKLDFEKELKIAQAELSKFDFKNQNEIGDFNKKISEIIEGDSFGSLGGYGRNIQKEIRDLEVQKRQVEIQNNLTMDALRAKVIYYQKAKDHSLFWFLWK